MPPFFAPLVIFYGSITPALHIPHTEFRRAIDIHVLAIRSTRDVIQALDSRIERLSEGDPDLEPDELQLAKEAVQRKQQELVAAQPAARHFAKIRAALRNAAEAYKRQIEKVLHANPREASEARVILQNG